MHGAESAKGRAASLPKANEHHIFISLSQKNDSVLFVPSNYPIIMKLYVLQCANKKWYVGKTSRDVSDRVVEHFAGEGSEWTRLHKPLKLVESKEMRDDLEEDGVVKTYMKKYGVDNVRGGSYSAVELPDYKMMALEDELNGAADKCFRCGRKGHFVNDCYARTHVDGSVLDDEGVWVCEFCGREFETEDAAVEHEKICQQSQCGSDYEWLKELIDASIQKTFLYVLEVAYQDRAKIATDVNNMTFRIGVADRVKKAWHTGNGVVFEFLFDVNNISMYKMIEKEMKKIQGVRRVERSLRVS